MEPLLFDFLVCFGLENVSSTYTLSDKSQHNCGKKHVSYHEMTSNILPKITAIHDVLAQNIVRTNPGRPGIVRTEPASMAQYTLILVFITTRPNGIIDKEIHKMHQFL